VLEQEIRGGGDRPAATSEDDEELKLYALDSLMQAEPEQAVPVLERLLAGNASSRLKERALFVLSQSDSPQGTGDPDAHRQDRPAHAAARGGHQDAGHGRA
jgi:hypothetical protein